MDLDLSDGFMQDMVNIMEYCLKNDTSTAELEFDLCNKRLLVEMRFSVIDEIKE